MLEELIDLKEADSNILSRQFDQWLFRDRGRQIRGIEYFLNQRSENTDKLIREAFKQTDLASINDFGIFSVGGYGRGELHPYSDIDLLLLSKTGLSKEEQKKIEKFISLLWDLGLEIGHSVRTLKQAKKQAREDVYTMTNMLEFRKIAGTDELHRMYLSIIDTKNLWRNKSFIQKKVQEQIDRHQSFNNTSYNLEPDIKSSPGGLRDIHTIDWLIKNSARNMSESDKLTGALTTEERKELNKAKYWLWVIRYLTHLEANREEDRLLFEHQIPVAMKLFPSAKSSNQAAEKLMHRYYRSSLSISEINSTFIQSIRENYELTKFSRKKKLDSNFFIKNNLIHLYEMEGFKRNPSLLLDLFIKLSENPDVKGIGSQTLRALKRDRDLINSDFRSKKQNILLFLKLLKSKRLLVTQLEKMKDLGILGRYLPEFGRITGQMQYDLFHIYTVDAHTLEVLRNMRWMTLGKSEEKFPLAAKIINKLPKLEILYIAGLYHDIGKGRGSDHSNLGKVIVRNFCKKHLFTKEDTKLIEWLVENHLLMSVTSQKKDLTDNSVVKEFAEKVGNVETLNYLYCLTVADVSATNPNLWNSWNASLLRQLYDRTKLYFRDSILLNNSIDEQKSKALKLIKKYKSSEIENLWDRFYPDYFEGSDHFDLSQHAEIILSSKQETTVEMIEQDKESLSSIFIHTKDRANLFATIVGILDSENINFIDAKLYGMKNGFCTDLITISDQGNKVDLESTKAKVLIDKLNQALNEKVLKPKIVKKRLPRHLKHFQTTTEISFNHDMSNRWTNLEIKTADRPGLLASICQVFLKHGALIKKARIATYGEKAEDRFSITSKQDTPFIKKNDLNNLLSDLKTSLSGELR
jgi:[protein-PII] uridylyltransferase